MACNVAGHCEGATFYNGWDITCTTRRACQNVNIGPGSSAICSVAAACPVEMYIWGSTSLIKCSGNRSCKGTDFTANQGANIACIGKESCKNGSVGCAFVQFPCSKVPTNTVCAGANSCDGVKFYGDYTTATCKKAGVCDGATFVDGACCKGKGCPKGAKKC
eukprot:TRINITY_DN935_c0_g1_i12.p1 TRINITY_DN935_c0_g1~~TRINITY_DN935_c0_g1_i12.p1  ORF type:complete len:162 (+),score=21.58 TRINITY_DN935_c0_g1_i12:1213-1698(+)